MTKSPDNFKYTNCNFITIENVNLDSKFNNTERKFLTEEDAKQFRKKMIEYVSTISGFNIEMIERVLDITEEYLRNNNQNNNEDEKGD